MASKVEWIYSLVDNASKNAKGIALAIDKVTAATKGAAPAMKALEDKIASFKKNATDRFGGLVSGLRSIATYSAVAAGAVVGVGAAFGVAVFRAQAFKETTMTSLTLLLGDAKQAKALWDDAVQIARKTPMDTKGVISAFQNLLSSGFKTDDSRFMLQALGDVASTHGESAAIALEAMITPLSQMKAFGKIDMGNLKQLTGWSQKAGLGIDAIIGSLGKTLGKTNAEIQKMMEQGLITADQGIFAIMKAIQDGVSHGVVGSMMMAQSKTLSGLMSTLESKPFEFFTAIETGGGLDFLRDALYNITEVLDPTTEAGGKLLALVQDLASEIFGVFRIFSGSDGQKKFSEWLIAAVDGVRELITQIKTGFISGMDSFRQIVGKSSGEGFNFVEMMKNIGITIGIAVAMVATLAGVFVHVKNVFEETARTIIETVVNLVAWFGYLGAMIVDGFMKGLSGIGSAIASVASTVVSTFSDILSIGSPSKVFEGFGKNTIEGYNLGLEGEPISPVLTSSSFGGQVSPTEVAPRQSGGRGPVSVNVNLSVDARGGDGAEIARKVAEILPGELLAAFEAMAIEGGVA